MKATGQLLYGVPHGDTIHYDYTVTVPVIRHTVAALAATNEAFGETDSPEAQMYYRVATMAEVLQTLGDLPKEEITADLLLDGLTDDDMDILDAELTGLKKKRMRVLPVSQGSGEPPSSSDDSASAQTVSTE
ncbi:hypothetical protein [Klebsiella pneumoniae]|uniref:hypothetical protein n=1 Tax=Klebsiella pneumoniae TaxID=573 RepID=UPI000E0656D9|nr:hypothetical protein [Klebsiella pneumoniae]STV49897.1 Uncharacterised protein [Klebsiella pneumoniae]SXS94871.1 Uncharacterised protein [Klebsiella pneumoniae]SXU27892.1 Uncharacterised protein [Klebsiella pneumoniae]